MGDLEMKRSQAHHEFQKALLYHRDLLVGQFPELKALYAVPNGGLRDKGTAKKLKAEGATAGVWDCHLPVMQWPKGRMVMTALSFANRECAIGLWIEIKIGKDKLSPEQIAWKELLEPLGHKFYVARDMMQTLAYIKSYLRGEV
jgi:hypothetical protein